MPDYSKAVIYTIRTKDGLYVGSTTNFIQRKHHHNTCIYYEKKRNLYETINKNKGEWDMKPYKEFPCENKLQLNMEEERVRRELNADLNMNSCCGMDMEKHKIRQKKKQENLKIKYKTDPDAKMKKREADKKWRENNKGYQTIYHREYRKKIKDKNKD